MQRLTRLLSFGGCALAVLALSQLHGRVVADPQYSFTGTSRFGWAIAYTVLLGVATYAVGLPEQPRSARHAAWLSLVAVSVAALGVSLVQLILGDALLPRFVVFGTTVLVVPWQVAINAVARGGRSRDEHRDRVLVVASAEEQTRLADDLSMLPERAASLVATLLPSDAVGDEPASTPLVDLCTASGAAVVVIDREAQAEDRVITQAATLHESGVRVRTLSGFYEEWLGKLPLNELERASLLFDIGELHRTRYVRLKRVMDLTFGLLGATALVLVCPVVLVGNAVANRGPLLYRQVRVGKGGEPFTILKFRTMRAPAPAEVRTAAAAPATDSPAEHGSRWTEHDDPRITPFGRLMRRTHLDELPQSINILRGDLALVGPRPEQPHYVEELSSKLAFYDLRHLVRPGLTGWAQVKYGYAGDERDALEKLQYEFFYLQHQDLVFDARIVLRTFRSITGGVGAGR